MIRLAGMRLPANGVLLVGSKIVCAIDEKSPVRMAPSGTLLIRSYPLRVRCPV